MQTPDFNRPAELQHGLNFFRRTASNDGEASFPLALDDREEFTHSGPRARLETIDAETGKEVWTTKIPGTASTGPVTYRGRDGRQYVAVVATGGNNAGAPVTSDQVIAYALPKK